MTEPDYREPAGHAPEEPERPLRVTFAGVEQDVHPHGFGRWACPSCGQWRWLALFVTDPREATGRFQTLLHAGGRGVLLRACGRCGLQWFVHTRTRIT